MDLKCSFEQDFNVIASEIMRFERSENDVVFRKLNEEQGITVILVTHDQDVAKNARRTIVLRDGRIVSDTIDFHEALVALRGTADVEA